MRAQSVIYMYGGVVGNAITNELWTLDTTKNNPTWQQLVPVNSSEPLSAVGHTAHVIDDTAMFVIFGHNPVYGYLNTVQRYDIGEKCTRVCVHMYGYYAKHMFCYIPLETLWFLEQN